MAKLIPRYEHFCEYVGCSHYDYIRRFASKPIPTDIEQVHLKVARDMCKKCRAYQLYRWLKGKGLTDLTSGFD